MNIVEAVAALVAGNAITKPGWNGGAIRAVQLDSGSYQLYATGEPVPEMLNILSGDFTKKVEGTI